MVRSAPARLSGALGVAAGGVLGWAGLGRWTQPGRLSIIGAPFLAALLLFASATVAASWAFGHWSVRWSLCAVALVLVVLFAAASVNSYYAYIPSFDALFGRRAADQISTSQFRTLQTHGVEKVPRLLGVRHRVHRQLPAHGVVLLVTIPPRQSHFSARAAQVYLPPAYFAHPRPELPVIELLHGTPGTPADWTRGGEADLTADAWAHRHHGFAPIIVMPDVNGGFFNDTECVNGRRGAAETYLVDDVRHAIVTNFGARPDRGGWEIAGLSEGGYCATMLALRHPGEFAAAANFSGNDHATVDGGLRRLFGGSRLDAEIAARAYDVPALLDNWGRAPRPALWFSCGRSDPMLRRLGNDASTAGRAGFDTTVVALGGRHDFRVWKTSFEDALPWLVVHLTLAPRARPGNIA